MTVKQLMNKLKRMPEDAKVVIYNDEMNGDGMYYATDAKYDETMGEPQVEIKTNYERIAKGWERR